MNLAQSRACLGFVFAFCTQVYLAAGSGGNESPGISAPRILSIGSYAGGATAVLINDVPLIHTTQLLPLDQRGELVGLSNVLEQAGQVLANVGIVLKANESDLAQLIKLNVYLSQAEALTEVQKMLALRFPAIIKPATCFVIGELPIANALVAMDAIATTKPPE